MVKPPLGQDRNTPELALSQVSNGDMLQDLSLLLTMPLDILYEVFSNLNIQDLLSITKVNMAFYHLLVDSTATSVWKSVRERDPTDVPSPAPRYSEYRWALLVFGPQECQVCGRPDVKAVDFGIRKRACRPCLEANLISVSKCRNLPEFQTVPTVLLHFLPPFGQSTRMKAYPLHGRYYWKEDIHYINTKFSDLYQRVVVKPPNPADVNAYHNFIQERISFVKEVQMHTLVCENWVLRVLIAHNDEILAKKQARKDEIAGRLLAMNYRQTGVTWVLSKIPEHPSKLTERAWTRLLPILSKELFAERRNRLDHDNSQLLDSRREIADSVLARYTKTLTPDQWVYLPPFTIIHKWTQFEEAIYQEDNVSVSEATFATAVNSLPALLSEWKSKVETALVASIRRSSAAAIDSIDDLRLARTVFICFNYGCQPIRPLISLEGVFRHVSSCPKTKNIGYYHPLSNLAAHLIELAGLDPETATVHEMDKLQPSFVVACTVCRDRSTSKKRTAFTWRGFVHHFLERHHAVMRTAPNIDSLVQVLNKEHIARDLVIVPPEDSADWSCGHCTEDYNDWQTQETVMHHLDTAHGISDPQIPRDLLMRPGLQYPEYFFRRK